MQAAAGNLKKISLELGGKSPNIIFADADFETAVDYGLFGIFFGAGQVCSQVAVLWLKKVFMMNIKEFVNAPIKSK